MPEVLQPTVLVAPYNDLTAVERIVAEHKDDLAAVIVEGVPAHHLRQARVPRRPADALCDDNGVLLILDEVVTGFRLALGGAQEYFGVTPDLAGPTARSSAAGGPLGCVAGKAEVLDCVVSLTRAAHRLLQGQPTTPISTARCTAIRSPPPPAWRPSRWLEQPGFYDDLNRRSAGEI